MFKRGYIPIGVILTFTVVGALFYFFLILANNTSAEQSVENIKDNLIKDIFVPEIFKAIKQHHKLEDHSFGYGIESYEVSKMNDSDYVSYYVLFNVEVMNQDVGSKNKLKTLGYDTIKFVLSFEKTMQIELISYSHNDQK